MQNFTGTGFSNEEIKKEDIAKNIRNKADAIMSLREMHVLLLKVGKARMEHGGFFNLDKNRSKKAEQEADRLEDEFKQRKTQMMEYLRALPHD